MNATLLFGLVFLTLISVPMSEGAAQGPATAGLSGPAMFPFVIPWDDPSSGTATDVSFLNDGPAGSGGAVVVRDGHFVLTNTGKRIRFMGVSLGADEAFPNHDDADRVAAHMAKLGINIVRLHHMDNNWGPPASTLIDSAFKDRQHLSKSQLDRLDYLAGALERHGIYLNVNLHVSRQFTDADGFPESVNHIPFGFDKRVDEFDMRMIALQKNYARDLLTHVNPYTHKAFASDPAVAVVEINNENSLVGDPWATMGQDLQGLPEPFLGELRALWNKWLAAKYHRPALLQAGWMKGFHAPGKPMLTPSSPWTSENQGTSKASMLVDGDEMHINTSVVDGTGWHVQVHKNGLNLTSGEAYTVTFEAKADSVRTINLNAGLDEADWHTVGLSAEVPLSSDYKHYTFAFTAHDTRASHERLAFVVGDKTGSIWIRSLQIRPGVALPNVSGLLSGAIPIPDSAGSTMQQHSDWLAFLADTERSYANGMRDFLTQNLHVHANIICSQQGWGGMSSVTRESRMEFADSHDYWQHPSFPHQAWDANDWTITNTAMVSDLAAGGGGTLRGLAERRIADKPYSVSEYNHPAPSDFRAEMLPELASFAAFQDWDMFYLFDWGSYGAGIDNTRINGYFGNGSDPSKAVFLPAAAMIFRAEEFPRADNPEILELPAHMDADTSLDGLWRTPTSGQGPSLYSARAGIRIRPGLAGKPVLSVSHLGRMAKSSISVTPNGGALYVASSHGCEAIAGFIGGRSVAAGPLQIDVPVFGNNFASVALAAMDAKPLAQSSRMLLTLANKVENQDMKWNADRTSVGSNWGHGPTIAEGVPAKIVLKADGSLHVWALDGTGHRASEVPASYASGALSFTTGPQFKTMWYEISR